MSATRLLVLGFVRIHGRAHGYLVGQELLAWEADKWANTKTGSIYHALRQLTKEGLLEAHESETRDGGPPRTDYKITEAGDAEFSRLLRVALVEPDPRPDMLCAGLAFLSALPRAVAIGYLEDRRTILAEHKASVFRAAEAADFTGENPLPAHVEALINFWEHTSSSSCEWVEGLIAKLREGAYVFADEDPKVFGTPGSRPEGV